MVVFRSYLLSVVYPFLLMVTSLAFFCTYTQSSLSCSSTMLFRLPKLKLLVELVLWSGIKWVKFKTGNRELLFLLSLNSE